MKARHIAILLTFALMGTAMLSACGGSASYADGVYTGRSSIHESEDEEGKDAGYGIATVTIRDNAIVECEFATYQPDDTRKDENYGKQDGEIANRDFYNKAQRAVQASAKYGAMLAEAGSLRDVDAISGATISFTEFQEAVEDALSQAKK